MFCGSTHAGVLTYTAPSAAVVFDPNITGPLPPCRTLLSRHWWPAVLDSVLTANCLMQWVSRLYKGSRPKSLATCKWHISDSLQLQMVPPRRMSVMQLPLCARPCRCIKHLDTSLHLGPVWLQQAMHHPVAPIHDLLINVSRHGGNCAPQF